MGWQQEYQQEWPEPLCPGCDVVMRTDGFLRHAYDCREEEKRENLKNDEKTQLYSSTLKKLES